MQGLHIFLHVFSSDRLTLHNTTYIRLSHQSIFTLLLSARSQQKRRLAPLQNTNLVPDLRVLWPKTDVTPACDKQPAVTTTLPDPPQKHTIQ